jgi:hypothetical protein
MVVTAVDQFGNNSVEFFMKEPWFAISIKIE